MFVTTCIYFFARQRHICVCVCVSTYMHACMHAYVHKYIHNMYTHTYTHTQMPMFTYLILYIASLHSAAEHRASTRILHLTLFLATVLISAQVFLTPLASSSSVLHHLVLVLPLLHLPWGFHSRACLAMSSDSFRSVWPSHPNLRFLICKSILGCFVHFHSSLFVIWSGQKNFNIFLRHLLIKTCSWVVTFFEIFQVSQP